MAGGSPEELVVSLELYTLLMELADGAQILDAFSDDVFANLSVFHTSPCSGGRARAPRLEPWPLARPCIESLSNRDGQRQVVVLAEGISLDGRRSEEGRRGRAGRPHGVANLDEQLPARLPVHATRLLGWRAAADDPVPVQMGSSAREGALRRGFRGRNSADDPVGSGPSRTGADLDEASSSETAKAILGDFLLTSTLENRRNSDLHDEQVQRCFANHYLASWIDLPVAAANLRGVPEMITALLGDQREGAHVKPFTGSGRYPVGTRVEENALLEALGPGIVTSGARKSDLRSDELDEAVPLPHRPARHRASCADLRRGSQQGRGQGQPRADPEPASDCS